MTPENGIKIGFLTSSVQAARDILLTIQKQKKSPEPPVQVFPATDTLRMLELVGKYKFSLFIIEEDLIDCSINDWIQKIERAMKLKDPAAVMPPMILLLKEGRNAQDLKNYLAMGFSDLIAKPLDMPILIQKIDRLVPEAEILDQSQFFRMETNGAVGVALSQIFESVSETDATVLSSNPHKPGDVVSLYGEPFNDEAQNREVIAVCLSCQPSGKPAHPYKVLFGLQGITPSLSQSIRKWIKSQSAREAMRRIG